MGVFSNAPVKQGGSSVTFHNIEIGEKVKPVMMPHYKSIFGTMRVGYLCYAQHLSSFFAKIRKDRF